MLGHHKLSAETPLRRERLDHAHHQHVVPESATVGRRWSSIVTVPSHALAAEGEREDRRKTSTGRGEVLLEVRRTFVAGRLSAAYLAAAYAQVVPRHRRRMGHPEVREAPFEATGQRAAGEGRGIRDV